MTLALSFPDQTYSASNKPSTETLKNDLTLIEEDVNAHEGATTAHGVAGTLVGTTDTQTLTNKTLTSPAITTPTGIVKGDVGLGNVDNTSDATKNAASATLTNKTLTNPVLTKPTVNGAVAGVATASPAGGATATLDLASANIHKITMPAGNITVALSNVSVGQIFKIDITQDSVGSRTVTWFSTIRWAGGSAPTLTTTASKRDSFGFECTGSGTYDGYVIGLNL